jgi:hypothetical protein
MPGKRFSKKQDRQAHHVADTYGGGKKALSIGYAVVSKQKNKKKRK